MKIAVALMLAGVMVGLSGCATQEETRDTAIGSGLGAGLGAILGNNFGGSGNDRAMGAAAGALLGGMLGHTMGTQSEMQNKMNAMQQNQTMETVWITNSNGSKTPVLLRKAEGGQYIGPRGEYYTTMPSEDQLRRVYGM